VGERERERVYIRVTQRENLRPECLCSDALDGSNFEPEPLVRETGKF